MMEPRDMPTSADYAMDAAHRADDYATALDRRISAIEDRLGIERPKDAMPTRSNILRQRDDDTYPHRDQAAFPERPIRWIVSSSRKNAPPFAPNYMHDGDEVWIEGE